MAILSTEEFVANLDPGLRLMALDVGSTTIGLATNVWGRDEVMPLKTLARVKFTRDAESLVRVMQDYDVQALVVGWPLLPDGRTGKRCQSVRDFTAELERFLVLNLPPQGGGDKAANAASHIPITFWDERFSTAHGDEMVDNIGKAAGKRLNKEKRDQVIDALAAQRILEDFIVRF